MKNLILSLLKLIPIKQAIEIILKYLTDQAKKTSDPWDDEVMIRVWQVYNLLKGLIPDHIKTAMQKLERNKEIV